MIDSRQYSKNFNFINKENLFGKIASKPRVPGLPVSVFWVLTQY